jgi:hypothetical protein
MFHNQDSSTSCLLMRKMRIIVRSRGDLALLSSRNLCEPLRRGCGMLSRGFAGNSLRNSFRTVDADKSRVPMMAQFL